jgi:sugar phosphate isomerase/epimerase
VASLTREAEDLGITLAVENMPSDLGFLLETPEDFEKLFQAIDSRSVGIAFDVGHANTHGNTSNFINRLMDRIVHVHVHDNDGSSDSHEPIGQGTVHWRQLLRRLEQERFNGMIIVETLDDPISDVKRVSRLIDRS